jgi:hypothetical protein
MTGVAGALAPQLLDQSRIVLGGARLEALDRIRIRDAGGGREDAGAGIGARPASRRSTSSVFTPARTR